MRFSSSSSSSPKPIKEQCLRRSARVSQYPAKYNDYVCDAVIKSSTHHIAHSISYASCSSQYLQFLAQGYMIKEPKSFSQANKSPVWISAMKEEIHALETNDTWSLVDLPTDKTVVDCRWVFKVKLKSDGTLERYKARLVAKGFAQIEGLDFHDTFAPVVKMTTVRCLMSIVAAKGWFLFQLDVNNAFLHGILKEEVYMKLLPGSYNEERSLGKVCKLKKSIYGLKQASSQWFSRLFEALLQFLSVQSSSDHSMFTIHQGSTWIVLIVYVDDVI